MAKHKRLYKVLAESGRSCHGGNWEWSLPRGKRPGKWTPKRDVNPCNSGWHLCRGKDLASWIGARIWLAEARGEIQECEDKIVCESVRLIAPTHWDNVSARLCAADFAAHVLANFESRHCGDGRPRESIIAARKFARGEIDSAACSAARSAAYSAAYSAARSAAYSAARSAACSAACSAAYSAARSAARSAAYSAAYSAARSAAYSVARSAAEQAWQAKRIEQYALGLVRRDTPFPRATEGE